MKVMSTIIAIGLLGAAGAAGKPERVFEPAVSGEVANIAAMPSNETPPGVVEQQGRAMPEWRYSPAVPYVAPKVPI